MPLTLLPGHAPDPNAMRVFTGCHTPTGWACLEAGAGTGQVLAVGEPGPWMDAAQRKGWDTAPIDLCAPEAADRLAPRLMDVKIRVLHPLVQRPRAEILPSTAALLAAIGRSGAGVERFVLGGSACVWRKRAHRWSVLDASPCGPALSGRAGSYLAAERLVERAAGAVAVRLRAAPLWDAPERGLRARMAGKWLAQPKEGRALVDPLSLASFARGCAAALDAPHAAAGHVYGLGGGTAWPTRQLAVAAGAKVFAVPSLLAEGLGMLGLLGWDRDLVLAMSWTLTLSGSGAHAQMGWQAGEDVLV